MANMSCFSTLLTGRRPKRVVADAKKCPEVKPVELIDARPVAAPDVDKCGGKLAPSPCDVKIVADVVAVVAHNGGDMAPVRRNSTCEDSDLDFHPRQKPVGSDVHGAEKGASGAVPDAAIASGEEAAAAAEADPSLKLKRSCSNIETKRPGPRDAPDMPARSRSYGDLRDLPGGGLSMQTTPRGAAEASPASVKTSRTADRVMLKRRSSSQVLPSRSRKLWWRFFLWSHRNLHRPWSARPSAPSRHGGGYTSDMLEEGPSADRKNKKAMVDESPPATLNQWVAFSAENSLSDRVNAWVSSIESEPFCLRIAEKEDDGEDNDQSTEHGDRVARPLPLETGEPSGKGRGKPKRCAAADEVAQANSIVQSLNAFSSVAHISGMGLKVAPMIAPFSSLRAVNLSGNFIGERALTGQAKISQNSSAELGLISCSSYLRGVAAEGPALARSVAEQDRQYRGAPGADEAARSQPQLQPHFAHRPRSIELHGDQGAVPGGEQDQRRGGAAPAAEAGGAGPGLQQAHHGQGAGAAGGQLPLPPGAQPRRQPGAGQRRRRRAAQGRHGPPPAARLPQQAAREAAARAGGGHGQRGARGARGRRRHGGAERAQAGVAAAEPEPRVVFVVGGEEQVQEQAAPRLESDGKEVKEN